MFLVKLSYSFFLFLSLFFSSTNGFFLEFFIIYCSLLLKCSFTWYKSRDAWLRRQLVKLSRQKSWSGIKSSFFPSLFGHFPSLFGLSLSSQFSSYRPLVISDLRFTGGQQSIMNSRPCNFRNNTPVIIRYWDNSYLHNRKHLWDAAIKGWENR